MQLTEKEKQRRRTRSIAIACVLAGIAAVFFIVTIMRLGANVANRPY